MNGTAAASEDADAISMQSRALDLAKRPPNEMSVNEMKEFLHKDNLKEVSRPSHVMIVTEPTKTLKIRIESCVPRLDFLKKL